jgi:hypothetical protein
VTPPTVALFLVGVEDRLLSFDLRPAVGASEIVAFFFVPVPLPSNSSFQCLLASRSTLPRDKTAESINSSSSSLIRIVWTNDITVTSNDRNVISCLPQSKRSDNSLMFPNRIFNSAKRLYNNNQISNKTNVDESYRYDDIVNTSTTHLPSLLLPCPTCHTAVYQLLLWKSARRKAYKTFYSFALYFQTKATLESIWVVIYSFVGNSALTENK